MAHKVTREPIPGTLPPDDSRYLCNSNDRGFTFYGGDVARRMSKTRRNLDRKEESLRNNGRGPIRRYVITK